MNNVKQIVEAVANRDVAALTRSALKASKEETLEADTFNLLAALMEALEREGGRSALPELLGTLPNKTLLPLGREGVNLILMEVVNFLEEENSNPEFSAASPEDLTPESWMVTAIGAADVLYALAGSLPAVTHLLDQVQAEQENSQQ